MGNLLKMSVILFCPQIPVMHPVSAILNEINFRGVFRMTKKSPFQWSQEKIINI